MSRSILIVLVFLASTNSVAADRSVSVIGTCVKNVVPDRASLRITADVLDANVTNASKKATDVYEKVREDVRKLNLKDGELETVEYSVQEVKEWTSRTYVSKGFRARIGLLVSTSDIKRMGEVIALAAKHGVRETGQLTTFLSDYKDKSEREACLEEAIKNARAKADRLAQAAGAKVGKVVTISETVRPQPLPQRPMMAKAMRGTEESADPGAPGMETKGETMMVFVDATFELN